MKKLNEATFDLNITGFSTEDPAVIVKLAKITSPKKQDQITVEPIAVVDPVNTISTNNNMLNNTDFEMQQSILRDLNENYSLNEEEQKSIQELIDDTMQQSSVDFETALKQVARTLGITDQDARNQLNNQANESINISEKIKKYMKSGLTEKDAIMKTAKDLNKKQSTIMEDYINDIIGFAQDEPENVEVMDLEEPSAEDEIKDGEGYITSDTLKDIAANMAPETISVEDEPLSMNDLIATVSDDYAPEVDAVLDQAPDKEEKASISITDLDVGDYDQELQELLRLADLTDGDVNYSVSKTDPAEDMNYMYESLNEDTREEITEADKIMVNKLAHRIGQKINEMGYQLDENDLMEAEITAEIWLINEPKNINSFIDRCLGDYNKCAPEGDPKFTDFFKQFCTTKYFPKFDGEYPGQMQQMFVETFTNKIQGNPGAIASGHNYLKQTQGGNKHEDPKNWMLAAANSKVRENKMNKSKNVNEAAYNLSVTGLETTDAQLLSQMLQLAGQAEQPMVPQDAGIPGDIGSDPSQAVVSPSEFMTNYKDMLDDNDSIEDELNNDEVHVESEDESMLPIEENDDEASILPLEEDTVKPHYFNFNVSAGEKATIHQPYKYYSELTFESFDSKKKAKREYVRLVESLKKTKDAKAIKKIQESFISSMTLLGYNISKSKMLLQSAKKKI